MNRTGLVIAFSLALLVGLVFGLHPVLDLQIAELFAHAGRQDFTFGLRFSPAVMFLREGAMWLVAVIAAPAVVALAVKLLRPQARLWISGRAILFLLSTLALAPGLVVNAGLKDHWSRSRPIDVAQFGGKEHFVPWWDPRGDCDQNCSFVSGDVAGAFWTLAPAALAPPAWRAAAYAGAIAFGSMVAGLRILAGGHFFSDVFFAGFFTFLIVWLVYALIYRWPRTRLSDEAIEHALERLSLRRAAKRDPAGTSAPE